MEDFALKSYDLQVLESLRREMTKINLLFYHIYINN